MANNNVVKIVGSTTTYENVMGGYAWESSASGNQVFLTGTNTIGTSVFGGDGETGASNNELSIQDNSTIGEKDNEDTGYAIGGFTHTGTALSNKVKVEGGTINYAVGGLSDQDGSKVESNELTITGGTIYTEAAGGLIDGKVEYEANGETRVETEGATKNIVTMNGGEVRNLSGGRVNYYATGDAIANEVYVSDEVQIDYLVRGGSTYYGNANNNIVEMTGGTAGMGVEGGESGADLLIQTNKYHKKSNRTLILIMQPLELR